MSIYIRIIQAVGIITVATGLTDLSEGGRFFPLWVGGAMCVIGTAVVLGAELYSTRSSKDMNKWAVPPHLAQKFIDMGIGDFGSGYMVGKDHHELFVKVYDDVYSLKVQHDTFKEKSLEFDKIKNDLDAFRISIDPGREMTNSEVLREVHKKLRNMVPESEDEKALDYAEKIGDPFFNQSLTELKRNMAVPDDASPREVLGHAARRIRNVDGDQLERIKRMLDLHPGTDYRNTLDKAIEKLEEPSNEVGGKAIKALKMILGALNETELTVSKVQDVERERDHIISRVNELKKYKIKYAASERARQHWKNKYHELRK